MSYFFMYFIQIQLLLLDILVKITQTVLFWKLLNFQLGFRLEKFLWKILKFVLFDTQQNENKL